MQMVAALWVLLILFPVIVGIVFVVVFLLRDDRGSSTAASNHWRKRMAQLEDDEDAS